MTGAAPSPDPNKEVLITNSTGVTVAVLMPTTSRSPDSTNGALVYDQDMELLSSTEGSATIADSATATFVLDQYYDDPKTGKKVYSTIYNLLVSSADWYTPLDNIGVMQDIFSKPPKYPAQTATADAAKSLRNAGLFYQTISAYPTSALAKNFQKAMSDTGAAATNAADGSKGSSDNVANAIDGGVAGFFKSTKQFQDVTLSGLVAMETYYRVFPFVWAKYGKATYYLYSSDGKTTSFAGTIGLTGPTVIDVTKPNGGYTCTFSPAKNPSATTSVDVDASKAKALTYTDGLFVDNPSVDEPTIAVKGTFQIKRLFTQKPSDTQIITVLTGTIDGATVIGFDSPQKQDDKENSAFWNSLFHPKNAADIFKSIMTIGGAVMMVFFFGQVLYGIFKWARGLGAAKKPTLAESLRAQQEAFEKSLTEKIDAAVKKISGGTEKAPPADDAAKVIEQQRKVVADNQNAGNLEDGLKSESDNLEQLAEYEPDMSADQLGQLESAGTKVENVQSALDGATPDSLSTVVSEQTEAFNGLRSDVSTLTDSLSGSLSARAKATIADNAATSKAASENIDDSEQNAEEDAVDDDPVSDDAVFPEG